MSFRISVIGLMAVLMAGCTTINGGRDVTLDGLARDYVRLTLEIDAHESGYVDAYYGPEDWREDARKNPRGRGALKAEADRIVAGLRAHVEAGEQRQRAKVLSANVASARFRLDMIDGVRATFADEAEKLFALRPQLKPLSAFDDALARIERVVPAGEGTLAQRVEAFRARYSIPADKLDAVMHAAVDECRKRTSAHIPLPTGEAFRLEVVKGKSWGAYNYYQGQNQSLIQVNTDLPVSIGNALLLACHEGYPGHHVQGMFNEKNYREKGWAEYAVMPLYVPAAPLNEGGADYSIELAFPGEERLKFEMEVLYPLAGLDPASGPAFDVLRTATWELDGALLKVSQMHLDGEIDREQAATLLEKYRLASRDVAMQSLKFDAQYRSYVINYSAGEELVRGYVERHGHDVASRWAAYVKIMSEPTLPADLLH